LIDSKDIMVAYPYLRPKSRHSCPNRERVAVTNAILIHAQKTSLFYLYRDKVIENMLNKIQEASKNKTYDCMEKTCLDQKYRAESDKKSSLSYAGMLWSYSLRYCADRLVMLTKFSLLPDTQENREKMVNVANQLHREFYQAGWVSAEQFGPDTLIRFDVHGQRQIKLSKFNSSVNGFLSPFLSITVSTQHPDAVSLCTASIE